MKTIALLLLTAPLWADEIQQGWMPDPNIQYTMEPASSGDGCNDTASSGPGTYCAPVEVNFIPDAPPIAPVPEHHPKHHLGRDPEDMNTPEPGTLLLCGTALIFGA